MRSIFPNAEKYGPEITLYLDTFHAVQTISIIFPSTADPSKSEYVISKLIINKIKMFYKDLLYCKIEHDVSLLFE